MMRSIMSILSLLVREIDFEIEQRQHSGNDEDWKELSALSDKAHAVLRRYYHKFKIRCEADIDGMTQAEAQQWLIWNDPEGADHWRGLPPETDFKACVREDVRDHGYDDE